jgi:hypothetical protein
MDPRAQKFAEELTCKRHGTNFLLMCSRAHQLAKTKDLIPNNGIYNKAEWPLI